MYKQKKDFQTPKKYRKHEYVEYKYNVSNIVQYYSRRFPDIMNLFDIFSDICINKSDIGVSVEFSDEFIKSFFIDEFQTQLEERQQVDDMLAQQAMGLNIDETSGSYNDFGAPTGLESIISPDYTSDKTSDYTGNQYDMTTTDLKSIVNLFDSNGKRSEKRFKGLTKTLGSTLFDNFDDEVNNFSEDQTLDPVQQQLQVYDEVYQSVIYQYQVLISKIEKKIRKVLDNKLVKKVKYATKIADIYGYSIVTINKSDPNDVNIYTPLDVRLYKKKKSNLDMDNFIFAKIDQDGSESKLKVLNYQYNCYILSLDPMVMMPVPNIVRISWYLYLLDLVEILIIYNDLLKSKTIHLLEIPVFDQNSAPGYDDGVTTSSVTDNLALLNMIINNIESKLVVDTDYISNSENSSDTAMKLLKNVGLSVAYVPKLSPDSEMKNIKLDTEDNEYDKLFTMINEKIFAVLKFPLWFRTSTQVMATFKAIPREVVQFAHLVFMSRVNSALSELESFLEFIVKLHSDDYMVSYQGSESTIPIQLENVGITLKSILGEYLFDNYKAEQTRSSKLQNVLTFTSAGFTLNPHWVCQYVFPEYTVADILVDVGSIIDSKRQEVENALSGNISTPAGMEGSDLASEEDTGAEETGTEVASESTQSTASNVPKINWANVRASFAKALHATKSKEAKLVDSMIRDKTHTFYIKRV